MKTVIKLCSECFEFLEAPQYNYLNNLLEVCCLDCQRSIIKALIRTPRGRSFLMRHAAGFVYKVTHGKL